MSLTRLCNLLQGHESGFSLKASSTDGLAVEVSSAIWLVGLETLDTLASASLGRRQQFTRR